jgi:hypothetical protein
MCDDGVSHAVSRRSAVWHAAEAAPASGATALQQASEAEPLKETQGTAWARRPPARPPRFGDTHKTPKAEHRAPPTPHARGTAPQAFAAGAPPSPGAALGPRGPWRGTGEFPLHHPTRVCRWKNPRCVKRNPLWQHELSPPVPVGTRKKKGGGDAEAPRQAAKITERPTAPPHNPAQHSALG